MTKKQLQQYKWLLKNIKRLEDKKLELRTTAEKMVANISNDPISTSLEQDKMANTVAEMVDVENLISDQLKQSYAILKDIEVAISKLPDERDRYLINLRYIECKEWNEIAEDMSYSWGQIHRIHAEALKRLRC